MAENLHRAKLTFQERAEHIAEWVKMTDAKARVAPSGHTCGRPDKNINAATRELGIDRTETQRAVKIASMTPEAKQETAAAGIDNNQSALLRVAKEVTAEKQLEAIKKERDRSESSKRNREADRAISLTEAEQFAEWIMERADLNEMSAIISWLDGCATGRGGGCA